MLKKDIHIGSIVRKVYLERKKTRKITVKQFAQAVGRDRSRIYEIFEDKSIDIDLLINISMELDYNFLLEYFEEDKLSRCYLVIAEGNSLIMGKMLGKQ